MKANPAPPTKLQAASLELPASYHRTHRFQSDLRRHYAIRGRTQTVVRGAAGSVGRAAASLADRLRVRYAEVSTGTEGRGSISVNAAGAPVEGPRMDLTFPLSSPPIPQASWLGVAPSAPQRAELEQFPVRPTLPPPITISGRNSMISHRSLGAASNAPTGNRELGLFQTINKITAPGFTAMRSQQRDPMASGKS